MHNLVSNLVLQASHWRGEGWLLYYYCVPAVMLPFSIMCLLASVPWFGLLSMIVVFSDHTHLHFHE